MFVFFMIKGFLKSEMPRERLIKMGPEVLSDVELLAILLRVGTRDKNVIELSREILDKFDILQVSRKTYFEMIKFKGIGESKATQIIALFEFSRRIREDKFENKIKLNSSSNVYDYIKSEFIGLEFEIVIAVFVGVKNQVIKKEIISRGGINYSNIDKRELIKKALEYNASGLFLVHNHPSGDETPSSEDIKITKEIIEVFNIMQVKFLDHLIVGKEYYSMFDNDLI